MDLYDDSVDTSWLDDAISDADSHDNANKTADSDDN